MVSARRDRGQLILIGALTVALLVIGIAIVVNAVLFTENVRPSEANAQLGNAEDIDHELRRSTQSLTLRVNHATRDHSADQLSRWINDNVTILSHLYEESYINAGPIAVNVTYDAKASRNGSRFVQANDGTFVDENDIGDWRPVESDGGDQRLGWTVFNLNVTRSTEEPFHATFTDESGETVSMTFNKTLGPEEFEVETSTSVGGSAEVQCAPRAHRVLLNLEQGRSYTDDGCAFNGTAELGNVTTVEFDDGEHVVGKYSLVAKEESFGTGHGCPGTPGDEPCHTPVVWNAYVDIAITGDGFDLEKAHNVSVYPGGTEYERFF